MNNNAHVEVVTGFYDTHPINEKQVLDKLLEDGFDLSSLDQGILQDYDQDHFGGLAATETLARLVNISRSTRILDVCCGLGGPARYLAHHSVRRWIVRWHDKKKLSLLARPLRLTGQRRPHGFGSGRYQ